MIKIFKNDTTENNPRVGVGIPGHVRDLELLSKYSLPSAFNLDPEADVIAVNINQGEGGLKKVRTDLFDALFEKYDCDIIFNVSADMIISKDVLKYVREDKVVCYGNILKAPISNIISLSLRFVGLALKKNLWNGTYSLPRKIWLEKVRDSEEWTGHDTSLRMAIDSDFDWIPFPKIMIVRIHPLSLKQVILYHPANSEISTIVRMLRLTKALNC